MTSDQYDRRGFLKLLAGGVVMGSGLGLAGCATGRGAAGGAGAASGGGPRMVRAFIDANTFKVAPKSYPTRIVADLPAIASAPRDALSRFRGQAGRRIGAGTGFFRVQKEGERWWLADPDGFRFLHVAVNSVSPAEKFGSGAAFREKFGTEAVWAAKTADLLHDLGFNGTGSWSASEILRSAPQRLAYTDNLNFMASYGRKRGGTFQQPGHTGYPGGAIFVFDPEFETFCDEHAKQLAATASDPWLLGHFTDNEMPLGAKVLDGYLGLPETDPGNRAARAWLAGREVNDVLREEFRGLVADRYFDIVTRAIRRHDPNHLILGSRFYGSEKDSEAVFRAAGKHLDVVAVNTYSEWSPNAERFRNWARWSGRPVMSTEWYAKGQDSGMANTSGAGWTVATQQERGWFYQNFTLGLLETGVCVGWHWFKYLDNDPTDTTVDPSNRDSNKGMLTAQYEPYRPLTESMRQLNEHVYRLADYFDRAG